MTSNHFRASFLMLAMAAMLSTAGTAAADDAAAKGKEVYNGKGACAGCHGAEGKGDGPAGAALNPKPRDLSTGAFALDTDGDGKKGTEADLLNVITNGAAKYGGSMFMVGRPDLSPDERTAVAKYVMTLKK